jgi:hypothetical protein
LADDGLASRHRLFAGREVSAVGPLGGLLIAMSKDWLDRVREERQQLSERLGKLNVFLASLDDDGAPELAPKDIALLIAQSHAMTNYLDIIERRLARIGERR